MVAVRTLQFGARAWSGL